MKQTNRFWKLVAITLIITLIALSAIFMIMWQVLSPEQQKALVAIFLEHFEYLTLMSVTAFGVLAVGLQIIYAAYIKPIKKICAEADVIYTTNPAHRISITGNRDIFHLCSIINDFADLFENLNKNVTDQILTARKETEKERNLLAAIMSELPHGVIICNNSGRILLFNTIIKKLFLPQGGDQRPEQFIGLGRSIFHLIEKQLIVQSLEQIQEHLEQQTPDVSTTFISPTFSNRLIHVEMIPVLDTERQMTGFILTLDDATDAINQYDLIVDRLSREKKELSFHIEEIRRRLPQKEIQDFNNTFSQIAFRYDRIADTLIEAIIRPLPLTAIPVADIMMAVKKKCRLLFDAQIVLHEADPSHRILVDAYSFTSALVFLIRNIVERTGADLIDFSIKRIGNLFTITIAWNMVQLHEKDLESFLNTKINALPSLHYVFMQNKAQYELVGDETSHCSQVNIVVRARLNVPTGQKRQSPVIAGSRPEFYDFDLFNPEDVEISLLDTPLKKLTYTVFDTETTGLHPDGGDEIISIAAVRIVNNRIVYQDIFEELVDPKRDIPIESYKIHGINYEMVAGKKDIHSILPLFKQYTADTILVGHNIAFDMKMLKIKEKSTGINFSNPVLDTLLLSAVLHPVHEQHDMESVARRLGVNIVGRHTALGDAIATAEIFIKLAAILNSNGILTLSDALKASRKTYYARLKY